MRLNRKKYTFIASVYENDYVILRHSEGMKNSGQNT